jgi:hypothetical protein
VQLVSVLIVAVDEGRDFMEVVSGVSLALVRFLVENFATEISPGNDLHDSLDLKV